MNRLKRLLPQLSLVVAGVALGLVARQVLGPPDGDGRPPYSIDRPIAEGVEIEEVGDAYVPIDLPIEKLEPSGLGQSD